MSGNKFNQLPKVEPIVINKPIEGKKTIVVVGIGRSCTSLTAAVIDGLGVNMDGSYDGHFERSHFNNGDWDENTIKDLNNTYDYWGVQLVAEIDHVERITRELRNPHVIIVFRDAVANAQRLLEAEWRGRPILEIVEYVIKEQNEKLLNIAWLQHLPVFLLSCERLRYEPELIIDHLCDFIQIKGNKQKALDRIGNGYLIQ